MEFLVNIRFPDSSHRLSPEAHAELVVKERQHAAGLAAEGKLLRMWRVPGRRENWGLWSAADATVASYCPSLPWCVGILRSV
jgi:muconolactone D-isomerase